MKVQHYRLELHRRHPDAKAALDAGEAPSLFPTLTESEL